VFADPATADVRDRVRRFCKALDKTVIEMPDVPGFVVNRVLFPMLMAAVDTLERTGLPPETLDQCLCLGVGHPLGPLKTLDFIGLDVAATIAHRLDLPVPAPLAELVSAGRLGRKTRSGFFDYGS
jgi:3-hydroxybutyryl-CoA dehydrogenase